MTRLPYILFAMLIVWAAWFSLRALHTMPERIAIHFGEGGAVDGWTTHARYRLFILAFVLGLPVARAGLMAGFLV